MLTLNFPSWYLGILLDYCILKRSLESIEVTVTLTHLETTFFMLDLGEAYLGLAKLCFPLHGEGPRGVCLCRPEGSSAWHPHGGGGSHQAKELGVIGSTTSGSLGSSWCTMPDC